jgi:hypothetical protein
MYYTVQYVIHITEGTEGNLIRRFSFILQQN